jgi:D-inositol-3-phosphate glycosyltransferase
MRQKNVAMLSYHTCPLATLGGKDTGGMNVYVREVTRKLGECGVHVDVFTRSQDEHVPHVLHDLGFGNRVVHIPAGPEVPLPKKELATYLPQFVQGVADFAQAKGLQYDLIHSHYWMSGVAAIDLKAMWNIPMIHMFHTLGLMKNRVAQSESEKEGEYRIAGEREVIQHADRIVAATPAELSQLQFLYRADAEKITIIPPGVDTCHFYPIPEDEAKEFIGVPPCEKMLLFVGRIERLKGLDVLLEAICMLRDSGVFQKMPFCLSVIGGDPQESPDAMSEEMRRLQHLRAEYGLEDLVTLLGKRSQDSLPYYYSASVAVVVPSHYESFGLVALEAMACGTPVVASDVGGLAYLVKDGVTGFTVPVGDAVSLADRITQLISNQELRQRLGRQAAEDAQNYAWEKIVDQLLQVYAGLQVAKKRNGLRV